MKRPTFSIASLMVAVLFVAVGCVALRDPTPLLASVVFSLAVGLLATAVLLAFVRTGRSRAGWVGMASFGLAYPHFGFVGGDPGYPALITTAGYGWLADRVAGTSTTRIHRSFGETFETSTTSFVSRAVSPEFNRYAFGQVAHSMAALVVGIVGAAVGRRVADRNVAAGSRASTAGDLDPGRVGPSTARRGNTGSDGVDRAPPASPAPQST